MTQAALLAQVKKALRITHSALNDDIQFNINVCLLDLQRAGVDDTLCTDTTDNVMIQKAIELYLKSEYNFNGQGERFKDAYDHFVMSLTLCSDYTGGDDR